MSERLGIVQESAAAKMPQWRVLLRDAVFTFILACVVFGPITGLQLSGLDFIANWQRPLLLASFVTLGRMLFLGALNTKWLSRRLQQSASRKAQAASVQTPQEWRKW